MTILIITEPDDIHAALVKLALEAKGTNCELYFTADMPSIQKTKMHFSNQRYTWSTMDSNSDPSLWDEKAIEAVWWRRPRRPFIPVNIHQDDRIFVQRENAVYHDSIPFLFNEDAWWVNPIASAQKSKSKIIQLKIAQQCGFKLPETLISNSPDDIKEFINLNKRNQVIYKTFTPQFWNEADGIKILYTDKISLEDLPLDEMLQMVPGIYQQYIRKKYELRVTCFGTHISAVKIDSQKHKMGETDWREIPSHELDLSAVDLPESLINKIILFMKKIGVVFGCFDFIVTPEDDIIFLELNEQGQFLWIEEILPEFCYMDIFSEFLINKTFNFSWSKTKNCLSSSNFDAEAQKIVASNVKKHVYLNQVKVA